MARYVTRPKAEDEFWSDDIPRPSTIEVYESEPRDTGLMDRHGNTFWRLNDPIGFRIGDTQ